MGAMNVGQATPYVEAFSMAKAAAGTIFAVIDRKPVIDSLSEEGMKTLKWLINTSCGQVVRDFEREAKTRCNF